MKISHFMYGIYAQIYQKKSQPKNRSPIQLLAQLFLGRVLKMHHFLSMKLPKTRHFTAYTDQKKSSGWNIQVFYHTCQGPVFLAIARVDCEPHISYAFLCYWCSYCFVMLHCSQHVRSTSVFFMYKIVRPPVTWSKPNHSSIRM